MEEGDVKKIRMGHLAVIGANKARREHCGWGMVYGLPPGKLFANLKIAIEIVDLPMKHCDFP